MRKLTYGAAVSLDGFITGHGGAIDWLLWSDDAASISADSWKGVDAVLMGRKTWEVAAANGSGAKAGDAGAIKSYIFSSTLAEAPPGAELVRSDAVAFVRALKAQPGGDIILLGGGELATAMIAGGLVDEIGINVHPVLLGGGVPMFRPMERRASLELTESREIARGCQFLRYRVLNG